ncbi:MAG: hypothetical protein JXR76_10030 [Deltaproteobacteria bacterium]|nr:hypothetical protein [Deltaproteobacteria bacterium]
MNRRRLQRQFARLGNRFAKVGDFDTTLVARLRSLERLSSFGYFLVQIDWRAVLLAVSTKKSGGFAFDACHSFRASIR